jgi:sphinganine-1-phosphate aldolase
MKQIKRLPSVKARIHTELSKAIGQIESSVAKDLPNLPHYRTLPPTGLALDAIKHQLVTMQDININAADWQRGRLSGAIYHGGEELSALTAEAYKMFSLSNPLHPEVFPAVRKMEAECVSMVLNMYNAPEGAAGCMTSGGTESILMACKAYRDMARELKGITEPEMVVPKSAHAAFDKAAGYFGIRLVHVDVDPQSLQVDIRAVRRACNPNTILIVGSAPGFPHGIVDNIPELAKIARKWRIGLHVDCCLGGFLVPFMEKAGYPLKMAFDFRVPGITSISCDTHKYGFAPKGSSVIMYLNKQIRHFQYSVATDWLGGVYASPSVAGSRPGAIIAACWTAMIRMGESGYVESTRKIIKCTRAIELGVRKMPQLQVCGDPSVSVVAFTSSTLNIYAVGDAMASRGWHLNALQFPAALHIACTLLTVGHEDDFLSDLRDAVQEAQSAPIQEGGMAAVYGSAAKLPDRTIIAEVAKGFVDALYKA